MSDGDVHDTGTLDFVDLELDPGGASPCFLAAQFIPSRALMLFQARARLANGREVHVFWAPTTSDAVRALNGGPTDVMGNASFSFGAAILAPFANRIRGKYSQLDRTIETDLGGRRLRLPANGGGKAIGAEQYAIHGLILSTPVEELATARGAGLAQVTGRIRARDFGVRWPSSTELHIRWSLQAHALSLHVTATNDGNEELPIGIGWHPYFALPSGRRDQGRMRIPAHSRVVVNNYDEVLPTGEVLPVAGTRFDFRAVGGAPLLHDLDDCFVEIDKTSSGATVCEVIDPAAQYGLTISGASPQISAIQTFADKRPLVVIEPQFNWADPYGSEWSGRDTGMVLLKPSETVDYSVRLELFTPK